MTAEPAGYASVIPCLTVTDAGVMPRFGATWLRGRHRTEGRGIGPTEAEIGDRAVVMDARSDVGETHVHADVPDARATFAKAGAAGDAVTGDVRRAGCADRRGGVVRWISAQPMYRNGPDAVA